MVLGCIEKMQICFCRRINMKKYAKMMKMSCQNVVPKCANVTTISKTKLSLPYLKVTFQGFMGLRIFNYCHRGWQNSILLPHHQPHIQPHCQYTTSYIYHKRANASPYWQQCLSVQFRYTHNEIIVVD